MNEIIESLQFAHHQRKRVVEIRVSEDYLKEMETEARRMANYPEGTKIDKFMGIPIVADSNLSGKQHELILGAR